MSIQVAGRFSSQKIAVVILLVAIVGLAFYIGPVLLRMAEVGAPKPGHQSIKNDPPGLTSASANMYPGAVLYQRSGELVGTIINPGPEEVSIRMPDGSVQIKARQTVRDYYYVKK